MSTDVKAHKKRKRDGAQDAVNGKHKKHKSKEDISVDKKVDPTSDFKEGLQESKEERKRRRKEEKLSKQASQQAAEEIANDINDDNEKLPDDTQETQDLDEASQAKIERRRLKKLKKEQLKAEQRARDDEENPSVQVETQVMSSSSTLVPDSQSSQRVPATQLDAKVKGRHHKHKGSQSTVDNIPSTYTTTTTTIAPATTSTDPSPFTQRTTSLYVPLSPVTADFPLAGLCAEHLSPLLLHYYPPLKGIVLAYSNPSTSTLSPTTLSENGTAQPLALAVAEYAAPYIWLTATFTLLRPSRGARMAGHVILQNETHISLLCYNYFNASIERRALPREWEFRKGGGDGEGYFVDEHGEAVEGLVEFWALDFESAGVQRGKGGVVSIEGTMREEQIVKNKGA